MGTYIMTSNFPNGFKDETAKMFQDKIIQRKKFAFIASEFEKLHEKTDGYCRFFLNMFEEKGIHFDESYVVDGRMTIEDAQRAVKTADVVWLSGGDTPTEFRYLQQYGLDKILKQHDGVIIGMSAGSINMAGTAVCTLSCGHSKQLVYKALGCVDIHVEPHFVRNRVSDELLELSKEYELYGLCDESCIICSNEIMEFYGEIYRIADGIIEQVSFIN